MECMKDRMKKLPAILDARLTPRHERLLLWLILLVAATVRFWHYREIPFTHDELSALFRTHFPGLSTLIRQGVRVDGHPAGVQVFLYYWTRWVGETPWVVKLPFTLAGLFSVFLVYRLGRMWFGAAAGLTAAAWMAVMQYPVMYSQIARPYGSGLFLSLLMLLFWSCLMKDSPLRRRDALLYALSAALLAYDHHFGLLFAGVVAAIGLLLVDRRGRRLYLLALTAIILLYLPHLPITLHQLTLKGVGEWLGKPDLTFLTRYLAYLHNYSPLLMGVSGALFVFSLWRWYGELPGKRMFYLSGLWFLLVFLTGFLYSRWVGPVLQFSVLIFVYPSLLLFLTAPWQARRTAAVAAVVILILAAGTTSLVERRQHYRLFYVSPYERILTGLQRAAQEHPSLAAVVDSDPRMLGYYRERVGALPSYRLYDSLGGLPGYVAWLRRLPDTVRYLYLAADGVGDPLLVPVALDRFGGMVWQDNGAEATAWLQARQGGRKPRQVALLAAARPDTLLWKMKQTRRQHPGDQPLFFLDSGAVWGPLCRLGFDTVISGVHDPVDVAVDIRSSKKRVPEVLLVAELHRKGKMLLWHGRDARPFAGNTLPGRPGWIRLHLTLTPPASYYRKKGMKLRVYLWNRGGASLVFDSLRVRVRHGNPCLYGLFEPVPR